MAWSDPEKKLPRESYVINSVEYAVLVLIIVDDDTIGQYLIGEIS